MKGYFKKHFKNLLKKHCPLNTHSKSLKPQTNKHFKISLLKTCFISLLCLNSALGATHTYVLNSQSVILQTNEQRTDTAISLPARPSYDMTTFNCRSGGSGDCNVRTSLSIQGASGAKYTLQINDKTTTFFANSLSLSSGANVLLNGFHTISFERGATVSVGEGSSLVISNSGSTQINAQGSEYGGLTKVRFSPDVNLNLSSNSSVDISNIIFFSSQGGVNLGSNSRLNIQAPIIRFEKSFTNNGGTANFTTGLNDSQVKVGVYNVENDGVANFTQNGGTTTINGHFYNGGQTVADGGAFGVQDPVAKGGGNLVLNGGTMSVTGKLISQGDGLSTFQSSSISIYGATLTVGQGLQNKQGSTITFGVLNGKMGELKGNLTNENGTVLVDKTGASLNTSYKIISGTATGLGSVGLVGNNSQFFSLRYENGEVTITDGSEGGGGSKFEQYKNTLNTKENAVANALSLKFGGDGSLLDSGVNVQTAIADTNKAIKDSVIASPKGMINAFKGDTLLAPFGKGFETKRLAATELIRFDNGRRVKALQAKPSRDFYLSPVGAVLKANDTSGYVAGFTLGTNYKMQNFTNRVYLSYAYGAARQDLATQSTDTKAHLFQIGTMSRYKLDILETDINANFLLGDFKINNEWQETLLSSNSKFANYQLGFGLTAGARLGERLSIKPFAGIQNYLEMQEGFTSILGFESKSYNAYILDGILGVEGHYKFNEFASVYGKFSFESRLYNSHKHLFLRVGSNELEYENKGYDNAINAHLGTQILTYKRFKLDIEGLFRHYNTGLNYYGGSLIFKYRI